MIVLTGFVLHVNYTRLNSVTTEKVSNFQMLILTTLSHLAFILSVV